MWLVIGLQAAGKSTVADGLARRFDAGVHVRGGQFYRWALTGWVHTEPDGDAVARAHLELRYRLSRLVSDEYAAAGFTAVVQDNIFGDDVVRWLAAVRARPRHLVVLRPSVEAIYERDARRREATGKVAYRPGSFTVETLDGFLAETPRIGLWLDTSKSTPVETVDEIERRAEEAVVQL